MIEGGGERRGKEQRCGWEGEGTEVWMGGGGNTCVEGKGLQGKMTEEEQRRSKKVKLRGKKERRGSRNRRRRRVSAHKLTKPFTHHEVIHHRVVLNGLWCHANTDHGAPAGTEGKEGFHCDGGQVSVDASRAPVVVQQAPYEGLAKVGVCGLPERFLLTVQVKDEHGGIRHTREKSLNTVIGPET